MVPVYVPATAPSGTATTSVGSHVTEFSPIPAGRLDAVCGAAMTTESAEVSCPGTDVAPVSPGSEVASAGPDQELTSLLGMVSAGPAAPWAQLPVTAGQVHAGAE